MDFILNETPSMNNIYDSDFFTKTKNYEQQLANNNYEKAKNPFITGVVPRPAYNDMFMDTSEYNQVPNNQVKSLSGDNIPIDNFTHGNMKPFLRKGITQNTNFENNQGFYEKFGYNEYKTRKTEVPSLFEPMTDLGLIKGMNNTNQFIRERTNITEIQNNYNPIRSVKVAPGLNKGFTGEGSGGFHQADTLIYAKPKNKDELRPLSNQKNSIFEIPVQGPQKSLVDKRAEVAPFNKNRPETSYEQTEDNWFKGQSFLKKDTSRPEENLKDTSRIGTHIDYYGTGKNQIVQFNENDNYNKNSIIVYDTEKHELSKVETPVANFTSIIKGIVAPITDAVKITFKEYFIDNPRLYGNAIPQAPEKQTIYDPVNHTMKTTIKETNIHDSENINLTGSKETYNALYDKAKTTVKQTTVIEGDNLNLTGYEETYSDLYDEAKTTVKETTVHDSENINLTGNKETYSALYDDTKTTVKETTIHDTYEGNIKVLEKGYVNNNDKTKKTLRETLPCYDTKRNINNTTYHSTYTYDPKIVAKTTLKETMVSCNNNQYGFISGLINGIFGGYTTKEIDFKNTQRQFGHCEYNGSLKSVVTHIPTDRDAEMNMEVDETRELIQNKAGNYVANGAGDFKGLDKKDIRMESNKQLDIYECAEPIRNPNKIYQSRPIPIKDENLTRIIDKQNAYENRLDSDILSSLIDNPDIIKINPIRTDCKAI
jgi:hypothetical protein